MKKIYALILAGGNGERLKPISNNKHPKQFIKLTNGKSMLQNTVDRFESITTTDGIFISTIKEYKKEISNQLPSIPQKNIILEPEKKNTAPAILYSLSKIKDKNSIIIITPSDHYVDNDSLYKKTVMQAIATTNKSNSIVLLGIRPSRIETNFGYIKSKPNHKKTKFKEKPNYLQAAFYKKNNSYYWNTGIIVAKIDRLIEIYKKNLPNTYYQIIEKKCENYGLCENISIDYAILENEKSLKMVEAKFQWDDLGTFKSLIKNKNKIKNLTFDKKKNNLIFRENIKQEIDIKKARNHYCIANKETIVTGNLKDLTKNRKKREKKYNKIIFPYQKQPKVSIIIPVFNKFRYTYKCIRSIKKNTENIDYEIILADDHSTDETKNVSRIIRNIIHVYSEKSSSGFLSNCNNAAKYARGKYIVFLNNDTLTKKKWLKYLLETIERDKKNGLVGSKLLYPCGLIQQAGSKIYSDASAKNYGNKRPPFLKKYNTEKEVDYVTGASIIIKKELWDKIGGFDTRFSPAYYEDTDLAFEVRKRGYKVIYQPKSKVIHYEGISNGKNVKNGIKKYQIINKNKMYNKWEKELSRFTDPNTEKRR